MNVVEIDGKTKQERAPEAAEATPAEATDRARRRRRVLRFLGVGLVLVAGLLVLGHWLVNRWTHVYIADSRISADVITLSSEVAGRVLAAPVIAGDRVAEGDLLVRIETRAAEFELQEIDAQIARIEAEQSQLRAEQAMIRRQVDSKLAAARAELAAAEADHRASAADLENARSEYERMSALYEQGVVASRRFEEARARFVNAQQNELRAGAEIETARANLAVTEAEGARITVLDREIATLEAEKAAQTARRRRQLLDLEKRDIRAAFDGVVDQTFVDPGEYVSAGTRLLMYHDPKKVWVDANVKETEFRRLKIGAPAAITVDAYPDREFHGEVVRLGQAATSQFALLPSPNPSGNFTKVTQRLPVRIRLEQDANLLRPGMMVEVAIDVLD